MFYCCIRGDTTDYRAIGEENSQTNNSLNLGVKEVAFFSSAGDRLKTRRLKQIKTSVS